MSSSQPINPLSCNPETPASTQCPPCTPSMPVYPLSIKFDFRSLIPGQNLNSNDITLVGSDFFDQSLPITLLAENLIPGHVYRTECTLISPKVSDQVFSPASSDLYASYTSQNFVSSLSLPKRKDTSVPYVYIIQVVITDITEGFSDVAARQISLTFRPPAQNTLNVQIIDPSPSIPDNIVDLDNCDNPFPLVGVIKNATIGKEYTYEFYDNPVGGVVFENKKGNIYAGDINQNFNSRIALTGYPYVFVHAEVTDKEDGITRISEPVLFKCYQTDPCDVVLPTGIDVRINASTYKRCSQRGLTNASITSIYGGSKFAIGDKLTTVGGGGYGAEIQILFGGITNETFSSIVGCSGLNIGDLIEVTGGGGSGGLVKITSGSLTNQSINSISGCAGFKVGDHLTTVGGAGKDAVITVAATGSNGSISAYSITNPGYGFTSAPTGVVALNGAGTCAISSFNADNFTTATRGGIVTDSLSLYGGSGYNIGEILNLIGGGGTGAQVKILSGSITDQSIDDLSGGSGYAVGDYLGLSDGSGHDAIVKVSATGLNGSISSYQLINGGYGFVSAPNSLVKLTGNGSSATLSANANNFSITSTGSITKSSVVSLIGTGINYSVGSRIIAIGGGGTGGIIEVISVNNNGGILDFIIINGGSGFTSAPKLIDENQVSLSSQPSWNISGFSKRSYVVVSPGSEYLNSPNIISSSNGNGDGVIFNFRPDLFNYDSFIVVNPGSGYTSAPTGIVVRSGDGGCLSASFNDTNFTIPCAGGITYESVNNLIGKGSFLVGEELIVEGGEGSGGRIKVTAVNNGTITSFVVLNAGCGYKSEPTLKKLSGTIVSGVNFDVNDFTDLAIDVINPGIGFSDAPTGLEVLTGDGRINDSVVLFNDDNFVEIIGPPPTPSSTPTPTVTPSISQPARCNDIQTAGGQNTVSFTKLAIPAPSGQNYLIVADTDGLQQYSVVNVNGVIPGSYINKVENFFANFDNRITYKKLVLNSNTTAGIPADTKVDIYSTDIRLIKVDYWPGNMTFTYDAYSVPDRFKVFAVPMDYRLADSLLFDSGYRGDLPCGYAPGVSGSGYGTVQLLKPDGCIFIKVVVEAPCEGTAWEYSLSCPERIYTTITQTPTPTLTKTPTPTPSSTSP